MEKWENCINCGKCSACCVFLDKYKMNLQDYAKRTDLAYSCFLCGKCKRVCPVGIDGREISLSLRKKHKERGFGLILAEKKHYIFKNYNNAHSKTVFFPGCNLVSYYPKTTEVLAEKLCEIGIATAFDCCGKPVAELGCDEGKSICRLNKNFAKQGIEEIIFACPNCYYFLKDKIQPKSSFIYAKLKALNIENSVELKGLLHLPCPDKDSFEIFNSINFTSKADIKISHTQCCGAGGCAFIKEKELAENLRRSFGDHGENLYTYCATCAGEISKSGVSVSHILCEILGSYEKPARGMNSLLNRAKFKFKEIL